MKGAQGDPPLAHRQPVPTANNERPDTCNECETWERKGKRERERDRRNANLARVRPATLAQKRPDEVECKRSDDKHEARAEHKLKQQEPKADKNVMKKKHMGKRNARVIRNEHARNHKVNLAQVRPDDTGNNESASKYKYVEMPHSPNKL